MPPIPTLPSRYYREQAIWEVERREIFAKTWVMVGVDHELRQAAGQIVEQVAGWPIQVRPCERDGLRGCRGVEHAADSVANEAQVEIRAQSWRGFVFVCLDPTTADLLEWLDRFVDEWKDVPTDGYRFHSRTTRHTKMNWKVYNDNFLEGYHLPILHPELSRKVQALDFRVETKGDPRWNIQTARPRMKGIWSGVWGYFYPCFSFDVFPGGMAVERWLPVGKDRTDLIFEYFFADDAIDVEETIRACEEVADEDVRVCEMVQQNLSAGLYETGVLSPKHEHALAEFHQLVRTAVDPHVPVD